MQFLYVSVVLLLASSSWASPAVRIIGGQTSLTQDFPYVASIVLSTPEDRYLCAGSILNNYFILTSGTCVNGARSFTISLGSANRVEHDPNRVTTATIRSVLHPQFSFSPLENDIGLIRLNAPLLFNDFISAIELPTIPLQDFAVVVAVGWGVTSDSTTEFSEVFQRAELVSVPNSECRVSYGNQVKEHMVCTVGTVNEGICHGDVGGPLVQYKNRRTATVVGISSFVSGYGCESEYPTGFTRVYSFLDWINENISV